MTVSDRDREALVPAGAAASGTGGREPAPVGEPPTPLRERRFKTFDSLIDVAAFRWYLLSMSGNWSALQMQQVARGFLAYEITGSFAALGLVELANTWPRLFLALYGGVVADRASRRVIIQVGQAVNALAVGAIAFLLFTGAFAFWHLIAVTLVQGVLNSFVLPARQAMIPEIVGPSRLMNAYALNVFVLNVMRLGAPAIAGGLIALLMVRTGENVTFSVGVIFLIMALLNVGAVFGMFPIPRTDARTRAAAARQAGTGSAEVADTPTDEAPRRRRRDAAGLRDIVAAFGYLKANPIIIALMVIHSSTAMLSLPYQRLLPGFVKEALGGTDTTSAALMGFLLAVTAIGALIGSLLIASLPERNRGKILAYSLVVFGATLMAFSASTIFWLSAAIVLVLGIGQSIRQSIANILIQARVEDEYRGRVSAIMLLDDGLESLGIFGIALAADFVGSQWALGAVGVMLLVYGFVVWAIKPLRSLD